MINEVNRFKRGKSIIKTNWSSTPHCHQAFSFFFFGRGVIFALPVNILQKPAGNFTDWRSIILIAKNIPLATFNFIECLKSWFAQNIRRLSHINKTATMTRQKPIFQLTLSDSVKEFSNFNICKKFSPQTNTPWNLK